MIMIRRKTKAIVARSVSLVLAQALSVICTIGSMGIAYFCTQRACPFTPL